MPNIWSQLVRAQLENKASDYSGGTARGMIWWNTADLKAKLDDGTNVRALLRNDQACVFGNNGTANNNIRFQRGAASVLQFVLGGDTTAEGSLSTSLAQTSSRVENYTTAALPAFGNAGRLLWDSTLSIMKVDNGSAIKDMVIADATQTLTGKTYDTNSNTFKSTGAAASSVLQSDGAGNTSWAIIAGSLDGPAQYLNGSITASVAASSLTIAVKDNAGSDPSAGSPVKIAFRSATAATGTFVVRSITGALSMVVSSGSTLGHGSGVDEYIYVYAIDNAGTVELAVSSTRVDEGTRHTTTAEGGAGAADSKTVLYSTTARTNVGVRLIGRLKSNQAAAGTWATAIAEISLETGNRAKQNRSEVLVTTPNGHGSTNTAVRLFSVTSKNVGSAITVSNSATLGTSFTINEDGIYAISYINDYTSGALLQYFITLNEATLNAAYVSTNASMLAIGYPAAANSLNPGANATLNLVAGDVIRPMTDLAGATYSTTANTKFRIVKIAD